MYISNIKSGVYKIINTVNSKIYIGSSINCKRRETEHLKVLLKNKHPNIKLQNSFNKHGKGVFIFEIIEFIEDKSKLIEREQHYLDTLLSAQEYIKNNDKNFRTRSYNISPTAGSPLGVKHSEEIKRRCSERVSGKNNPNYGNNWSQEQKDIASSKIKGVSLEERIGKEKSDSMKQKISERMKGNIPWNVGVPKSQKEKNRISETLIDKNSGSKSPLYKGGYNKPKNKLELNTVICVENYFEPIKTRQSEKSGKIVLRYDSNMVLIDEWCSIKKASDTLKISRSAIKRCCDGKDRHAGFFVWRFKGQEEIIYKFRSNPILQINDNNEIIGEYEQIVIAAEKLKINRKYIGKALKNGKTYCGFYWKYKNNKNAI